MVTDDAAANRRWVAAALIVSAVGYSWVAGHFTTFTRSAEVVTFIPGLLGLIASIRRAPQGSNRPDRSSRGWLAWWLIVIALDVVELVSLGLGADHAHPTVSDLTNPWLLSVPARAVGFGLWLSLGYWLARR